MSLWRFRIRITKQLEVEPEEAEPEPAANSEAESEPKPAARRKAKRGRKEQAGSLAEQMEEKVRIPSSQSSSFQHSTRLKSLQMIKEYLHLLYIYKN